VDLSLLHHRIASGNEIGLVFNKTNTDR